MHKDKFIFSQLTEFLDRNHFNYLVRKYMGDKYIKSHTCWNHLLLMMFGQLAKCDSMRDLINVLGAHKLKWYHLGLGQSVSLSNACKSNEHRSYKIFKEMSEKMVREAAKVCDEEYFDFEGHIYAFDATIINLSLSTYPWAKFRSKKGGVKAHVLFDVENQIPAYVCITTASVHDGRAMPEIPYEKDATYIFDRAYDYFDNLHKIYEIGSTFVVRAKKNLRYEIIEVRENKDKHVLADTTIMLRGRKTVKKYPDVLRRVDYWSPEDGKLFTFLTDNFEVSALTIAELYRWRWKVELFFKWLKQHLKILKFWGTSFNAVRIQIYCAVITYCLIAIIKHKLKLKKTTYEILRVLNLSLFEKQPLRELLDESYIPQEEEQPKYAEGNLFAFLD